MDSGDTDVLERFFEKILNPESLMKMFVRIMTNTSEWVSEMENWQ